MADSKLSALAALVGSLDDSALFYIVQDGVDYKLTKAQLFSAISLGVGTIDQVLAAGAVATDKDITFASSEPIEDRVQMLINTNGIFVQKQNQDLENDEGEAGLNWQGLSVNDALGSESIQITKKHILKGRNVDSIASTLKLFFEEASLTGDCELMIPFKNGTFATTDDIVAGVDGDTVANIAARNAYDVPSILFSLFVEDDGDGDWALYMATSTGVGASFVKISDPDLLNAVMSNAAIKTAYESNADTNAFTNAEKSKLAAIASGATANQSDSVTNAAIAANAALIAKRTFKLGYAQRHSSSALWGNTSTTTLVGVGHTVTGGVARSFSDTNDYTRTMRLGFVTTTSTAAVAIKRNTITFFSRNCGFNDMEVVGFAENVNLSGIRFFSGFAAVTGAQANVEPDTLIDVIGICLLSSSGNVHIIHNDGSGTASTIDLGSNFPGNVVNTDRYRIEKITLPGSASVFVKVDRIGTAFTVTHELTTNLPALSTALCRRSWITNNANASAVGFDYMCDELEILIS